MGFRVGEKSKGKFPKNKKIRNATPLEIDGIQFKSKLEAFCYRHLKENKIENEYEKNTFILITPFIYNGEKIRACTYTPDFVGSTWVIEVKGFSNDTFPIKNKMFKKHLLDNNILYDLYLPRNQKEVLESIQSIKSKLNKK